MQDLVFKAQNLQTSSLLSLFISKTSIVKTINDCRKKCYSNGDNENIYDTCFGGSRLDYLKFHLCIHNQIIKTNIG